MAYLKNQDGFYRAHFKIMRGSFLENEAYCSKQGKLVEFGEPPVGKGGRTDRNEIYNHLKKGAMPLELMELDFGAYCRYHTHTILQS